MNSGTGVFKDRTYTIINSGDVSQVDFNMILERSGNPLRHSLDGSLAFFKYTGEAPNFLTGISNTGYSLPEILPIVRSSDWTIPLPP